MPRTLTTDRLTLRSLVPSDAGSLFQLIRDRSIADTTATIPFPYERPMASAFIAARSAPGAERHAAAWAIVRRTDETFLGVVSLTFDWAIDAAELGYWLGVPFQGNGYTTEACRPVVACGFGEMGLQRIHARHLVRNPASGRVLAKLGMRQEGVLRRSERKWGILEDVAYVGMLAEEWLRLPEDG